MNRKVLFVDDEPLVLQSLRAMLGDRFIFAAAENGRQALDILAEIGPVAVVVSDQMMPDMNGVDLLREIRKRWPDTVRVMLTGHADVLSALEAVNEGHIFRILTKPIHRFALIQALDECVEQYRLVMAERELLEKTVRGSVEVLTEILAMTDDQLFARAGRLHRSVRHISRALDLEHRWQYEVAAMLSQLGCIGLEKEIVQRILEAPEELDIEERRQWERQALVSAELVATIPRLEAIAEMIRHQFDALQPDSAAFESRLIDPAIEGAHLLRLALRYDIHLLAGHSHEEAIRALRADSRTWFGPYVVALAGLHDGLGTGNLVRSQVAGLAAGMMLASEVRTVRNLLVATKNQEITDSMLKRIHAFHRTHGIREPIIIYENPVARV